MNKKLMIIIISFIFIFSLFFIFTKNINSPESVIKDYITSIDNKNWDKLNTFRTYNYKISDDGFKTIEFIESMKLIYIEIVNDESIYTTYLHNGSGALYPNLSRNNVKIYKVKYDIKYKDDTISVIPSGQYTKMYVLIKENNSVNWKIDSIGEA